MAKGQLLTIFENKQTKKKREKKEQNINEALQYIVLSICTIYLTNTLKLISKTSV